MQLQVLFPAFPYHEVSMSASLLWSWLSPWLPDANTFIQTLAANTIVVGIVAFIARLWADRKIQIVKGEQARLLESLKGTQSSELEELKAQLTKVSKIVQAGIDTKIMVFKTHFELEFKSCQELWELSDNSYNIAFQTLRLIDQQPLTEEFRAEGKVQAIARYDECRLALDAARKKRPFVDKNVGDKARELLVVCLGVAARYKDIYEPMTADGGHRFDRSSYIEDTKNDTSRAEGLYDSLAASISDRIARMYISDFS
ncbi:hypothetical protein J2J97_02500 [Rhizobium bangladeshense]|uniref:hypothetical protein n=1 Tax=Rhizobium bangladeshense TaxID=1138189 RepID=UPI001A9A0BBB|nr:hypothetical protein [Rhizobium bangladeshense]QSY94835.1 hypothetical protein J2J97_02500 [Rhizobium bangladeshense]